MKQDKEYNQIMYKGKATCEFLKKIRKEIAEKNDIVYLTAECRYQGDCSGTCPKCDAEIAYLQEQIDKRIANNQPVNIAGISFDTYKEVSNNPGAIGEKDSRINGNREEISEGSMHMLGESDDDIDFPMILEDTDEDLPFN